MPELFVALNAAGGIAGFTNDPGAVGGLSLAGRVYRVRFLPADSDPPPGHYREGRPTGAAWRVFEPVACETGDCEACRRGCPAAINYLED